MEMVEPKWRGFGYREMVCYIYPDEYKPPFVLGSQPTSTTMSQLPTNIKAVSFSKTGDVDVIEDTNQPFPKQGPRDVILKVQSHTL